MLELEFINASLPFKTSFKRFLWGNYNISQLFGVNNTPNIEKYFISENEKSILGVVNRAINSIYDLQIKLFEGTQVDRGYDLIPAFNNESTVILGE